MAHDMPVKVALIVNLCKVSLPYPTDVLCTEDVRVLKIMFIAI